MRIYEIQWYREELTKMELEISNVKVWLQQHDPEYKEKAQEVQCEPAAYGGISKHELAKALKIGAPLHNGSQVSATELREFSRTWRRAIKALRLPEENKEREVVEHMLDSLGIACLRGTMRKITFQAF